MGLYKNEVSQNATVDRQCDHQNCPLIQGKSARQTHHGGTHHEASCSIAGLLEALQNLAEQGPVEASWA